MILWELACDIGTRTMEGRVASLLVHHILITSHAREDSWMIFMAIEEAPAKRHCHVSLAAGEILHQHLVWAYGVNDTSPYSSLQLTVRFAIAISVWRDVLWSGTHVLHRADHF